MHNDVKLLTLSYLSSMLHVYKEYQIAFQHGLCKQGPFVHSYCVYKIVNPTASAVGCQISVYTFPY